MQRRQQGITFIGWLFLLAPVALLMYSAIRLVPIFINYRDVARSLEQVADGDVGSAQSVALIRSSIEKQFDVNYVTYPDFRDIEIKRIDDVWVATANYTDEAPLMGNVSMLIRFNKAVEIR